jgi:hypothetical protein
MSDPRILGLTLMAIAIAAFLGSTSEALPPVTFFPALLLFAIGAFQFLRTNHEAMAKSEERARRAVTPSLRENRMARALADQQAASKAVGIAPSNAVETSDHESTQFGSDVNALEIGTEDDELSVTTDVSFPVELQDGNAIADQLTKLNQLLEQSVLTEEEYAIAKSKLLG